MSIQTEYDLYTTNGWEYQKDGQFTGKTYQDGIPTPSVPIEMTSVPQSFDLTSCGGNLFDVDVVNYGFANAINCGLSNGVYSATGIQNGSATSPSWSNGAVYIGSTYSGGNISNDKYQAGTYTLSFNYKVISQGTNPLTARFLIYSKDIDTLVLTNLIDIPVSTVQIGDNLKEFTFTIEKEIYIYSLIYINLCEIEVINYQIEKNLTAITYHPYTGLTQTNNLLSANCIPYDNKDLFPSTNTLGQQVKANDTGLLYDWNGSNYQLTKLRSLSNGTADSFNKDNRSLAVKELTVTSGTAPYSWEYLQTDSSTYIELVSRDTSQLYSADVFLPCRCNIAQDEDVLLPNTCTIVGLTDRADIYLRIPYDAGITLTDVGVQTAITNQVSAHGNIEFMYELAEKVSYPTHPDEAAKFEKLMKPKAEYDEYNFFINTPTNVTPDFTYDGTFSWQTPVIDRVLQNAINIRQKITDEKGVFSDTVWNRIKGNQIVLKYLIAWYRENTAVGTIELLVNKQTAELRQAWADLESWIMDSDLNDMSTNAQTLMSGMAQPHASYVAPKNDYVGGLGALSTAPDWNDINVLERTLKQVYDMIINAIVMWRYSGEPICSTNAQQIDIL